MSKTGSHLADASLRKRLNYLVKLLRNNYRLRSADRQSLIGQAAAEIDDLTNVLVGSRRAMGCAAAAELQGIRMLEIGCGQRCLAGLVFHSLGIGYTGLDLDVPTFQISPAIAWKMLRRNGAFRFGKALVRHLFFDRRLFAAYDAAFRQRGLKLRMDGVDIRVASADSIKEWSERFDLVYSFDVFEHLPLAVLEETVPAMLARLMNDGFCLIRLNPFPAIGGGHLVEWYNLRDETPRTIPAWEHLRHPDQATGDTHLNRLAHADYLKLFEKHGTVIRQYPNDQLGERYYTAAIGREFPQFTKEELCASGWTYLIKRRESGPKQND